MKPSKIKHTFFPACSNDIHPLMPCYLQAPDACYVVSTKDLWQIWSSRPWENSWPGRESILPRTGLEFSSSGRGFKKKHEYTNYCISIIMTIMTIISLLDIRLQLCIYIYIRSIVISHGYPLHGTYLYWLHSVACRATFSNIPRLKPQYLWRLQWFPRGDFRDGFPHRLRIDQKEMSLEKNGHNMS